MGHRIEIRDPIVGVWDTTPIIAQAESAKDTSFWANGELTHREIEVRGDNFTRIHRSLGNRYEIWEYTFDYNVEKDDSYEGEVSTEEKITLQDWEDEWMNIEDAVEDYVDYMSYSKEAVEGVWRIWNSKGELVWFAFMANGYWRESYNRDNIRDLRSKP